MTANQADPANCSGFTSASITFVLDAPAPGASSPLPRQFRSALDALPVTPNPPSTKGLKETSASGSAQYSQSQLAAVIKSGRVRLPLMVLDLRQEAHGFLEINPPFHGERAIAVAWFAERDWMNVGKGRASIDADERRRLAAAASESSAVVNWILTKTAEDGICTAEAHTITPATFATERAIAERLGLSYLRLPTTDHVRPRDSEVDEFVRLGAGWSPTTWLHFHCRGGDGRTTTFMVMHDIMCNAPDVSVEDILRRQHLLGGSDLDKKAPADSFAYPFAIERAEFVREFYAYVCAAKPNGYVMTWSQWVASEKKA